MLLWKVDFLCEHVGSNVKERTDMKFERACIKQEIADMKQDIADMKLEKAGMTLEINTAFNLFPAVMMTFDSTMVFHLTLL